MQYLGIDVSKAKIDCCLIVEKRYFHRVFKNTTEGFAKLADWLARYGTEPVHACLESTGVYSERLADWLYDNGHTVSLTNPLSIKKFAEMELSSVKTDKQDAKAIAIYCQRNQPSTYTPPPQAERDLKALTRHLDYLKEMVVAQQNRLQVASPQTAPFIEDVISHLRQQIVQVESAISTHIKNDPSLAEKAALLKTVRGIGKATIPHLLTLFGHKQFLTARQVTKYLGLNPIIKQSGNSKTKFSSISKKGDKHIRTCLYMPALVCYRLPEWQDYVSRLKANSKKGMQIIVAIMRKLAVYCFSVLKQGKPFSHPAVNLPTAA